MTIKFLGSNPILQINGLGLDRLKVAMSLTESESAVGYAICKHKGRIVFFQYPSETMISFPVALTMSRCAEITWDWLQVASYPKEPDHDGHNRKGWFCTNDGRGVIEHYGYRAMLAIEPHWVEFGK